MTRTSKGTQTGLWRGPAQEHGLVYDEDQQRNTDWSMKRTRKGTQTGIWRGSGKETRTCVWLGPAHEIGLVGVYDKDQHRKHGLVYLEDKHRNTDWYMKRTSTWPRTGTWRDPTQEHGWHMPRTSTGTRTGVCDEDQHRNTDWCTRRGPAQEHGLAYD